MITEVVNRIIELLEDDDRCNGVQIEPGWPGDEQRDESIWLDEFRPENVSVPVMTPDPKTLDIEGLLPFEVRVGNGVTLQDTFDRTDELLNAVLDAIRNASTLTDLEIPGGLVVSAGDRYEVQGPTCGTTPQGHVGFAEAAIYVHIRLND